MTAFILPHQAGADANEKQSDNGKTHRLLEHAPEVTPRCLGGASRLQKAVVLIDLKLIELGLGISASVVLLGEISSGEQGGVTKGRCLGRSGADECGG